MEEHFYYIYCHVIVPISGAEDTGRLVLHHSRPLASCLPPLCFATQSCMPMFGASLVLFPEERLLQPTCGNCSVSPQREDCFILYKMLHEWSTLYYELVRHFNFYILETIMVLKQKLRFSIETAETDKRKFWNWTLWIRKNLKST